MVLRKILSPKWEREDSSRKPQSEVFHDFYSSLKNIMRRNTDERDGWTCDMYGREVKRRDRWSGNLKERNHLEILGIDNVC
jgi:hypothetical protein